jgi:hypothetical protein
VKNSAKRPVAKKEKAMILTVLRNGRLLLRNKYSKSSIEEHWQISDKFPPLLNMPGLPLGRKNTSVFHKVHEVLREVFHWLCGSIGADVPGRAVFTNRLAVIVRAVKGLAKLPVDHQILMVMGQSMRPFMAEKLRAGTAFIKAEFGKNTRTCHRRDVDVTGGTVVLPAEATDSKGPEPNLHFGHGIAPQAQVPQLPQHMPVSSVQPRERHKPHRC